jgi:O-antigen/teichoic acid export membrane protein
MHSPDNSESPNAPDRGSDEKSNVGSRLLRTFRAFGAGQAIYICSQLGTIPLLITVWGKELYGEWILLASVPAYLTIADLGFGFAVANDVAMREAKGDNEGAMSSLQSAWAVVCALCTLFCLVFLLVVAFVPFWEILHITHISPPTCRTIACLLMVQVLLTQIQGVVRAPLRCGGNFVHGVKLKNFEALSILCSTFLVAFLHLPPLALAILIATVSVSINLAFAFESRRRVPWLRLGFRLASLEKVRSIAWPAFTQNLIPLSSALSIQGCLAVIGYAEGAAGPVSALQFSTTRTLTRLINQLSYTVASSFQPEFSVTAANKEKLSFARRMHHRASQLSFWTAVFLVVSLRVVGPPLYRIWTRHKVDLNLPTFDLLLLGLLFTGLYYGSLMVALSINKHSGASIRILIFSALAIPSAYVACKFYGIAGVAGIVALVEVATALYVVPLACRLIDDNVFDWLKAVLSPNFGWLIRRLLNRPQPIESVS